MLKFSFKSPTFKVGVVHWTPIPKFYIHHCGGWLGWGTSPNYPVLLRSKKINKKIISRTIRFVWDNTNIEISWIVQILMNGSNAE